MKQFSDIVFLDYAQTEKIPVLLCPVPAGDAAESYDEWEYINAFEFLTGGREGCALVKITGDSMVDQIPHGAWVVVDPYCEPTSGEPFVFRLNGRNTCKYFKRKNNRLFLVSGNDSYPSRQIQPTDELNFVGKVVKIITEPESKK